VLSFSLFLSLVSAPFVEPSPVLGQDGAEPQGQDMTGASAIAAAEFLRQAVDVLPLEERYEYHRSFDSGSIHQPRRDVNAEPRGNELVVDNTWTILASPQCGPLTRFAVDDTQEYFRESMQMDAIGSGELPETQWDESSKSIIVGTRDELAGSGNGTDLGGELKGSRDYEIRTTDDQIIVCGFDDAGVMQGLFNVQSRMTLREAPFLPNDLRTVRHSLYDTRMVLSWLGWMQWPDKYLSHLAHDGYNAIYASVYANPNGVPGPPHYDLIRQQDGEKLTDLINRAKKYGIKVITPILFNNTGEEENKQQLREHVRDIVTKFPDIRGYILLTEGFYYKKFFGAGGHGEQDLGEWTDVWTNAVKIVAEEAHKIDPEIEILPWEYNIDFRPTRVGVKRNVIKALPQDCVPLLTWENGTSFQIDGWNGFLRDYSISQVGPAEVAAAQIDEAGKRDMKVYCKVDCFATWQFGTTPYLPVPQQWQKRYDALQEYGVSGTLETWSNGYKPNFIAELRAWSCWSDPLEQDELLRGIARREFGRGSEDRVVQAWQHFSNAIQLVPDTGPSMGTNNAVAHPLFFDEPPPRMMTLHNSWWDEEKKTSWRHRMVEYWPFCGRLMIFQPDFKNRTNRAEVYARARSGVSSIESKERLAGASILPVFNKYVLKAADEFERGLKLYRAAALDAPQEKRASAFKAVLVVEQMQRMLRGLHAILEFEDLRLKLASTESKAEADKMLARMTDIVDAEIIRAEQSLETSARDSRLGYEAEMDYVYTPRVIGEKLEVLREVRDEQIPAYRKQIGLN
tara:strand:+ start:105445 stop:107829 length:2385 start_codon:yes stop_codon:yes gene_type:complete